MTDFERQRLTMVESQLRPNEVTDPRLLAAMRALPRERFVPRKLAGARLYGRGRSRSFPRSTARRRASCSRRWCWRGSSSLPPSSRKTRVLDIGCATGYSTAVLAGLGRR